MKQELILEVLQQMNNHLNNAEAKYLQQVLEHTLFNYSVERNADAELEDDRDRKSVV